MPSTILEQCDTKEYETYSVSATHLEITETRLSTTQAEQKRENSQQGIHTFQPSAYNFESRQKDAQPSIYADNGEIYVHIGCATFFGFSEKEELLKKPFVDGMKNKESELKSCKF